MTNSEESNKTYPNTEAHIEKGAWNPVWELLQDMDPDYLEAYLTFRSIPHQGLLEQKYKELIMIAINAATTHLYAPGMRRHMQNALKAGATKDEIFETIQLITVMGIHSCNLAVPVLLEEVENFEKESMK